MDFLIGMLNLLAQFLPFSFYLFYATGKGATADFGGRVNECLGLNKPVAPRKMIYNKFSIFFNSGFYKYHTRKMKLLCIMSTNYQTKNTIYKMR